MLSFKINLKRNFKGSNIQYQDQSLDHPFDAPAEKAELTNDIQTAVSLNRDRRYKTYTLSKFCKSHCSSSPAKRNAACKRTSAAELKKAYAAGTTSTVLRSCSSYSTKYNYGLRGYPKSTGKVRYMWVKLMVRVLEGVESPTSSSCIGQFHVQSDFFKFSTLIMTNCILRTWFYAWKQCVKHADCAGVTRVRLLEYGHSYYRYELRAQRSYVKESYAYSYMKKTCS